MFTDAPNSGNSTRRAILYAGAVSHASQDDIDRLGPLLAELRRLARLRERARLFLAGSGAFLHFYEHARERYVDARLGSNFRAE
jgi:hypothetical protein